MCLVLYSSHKFLFLSGGTLKINVISEDDSGTYTCIADNGNETIEAPADLSVQGIYIYLFIWIYTLFLKKISANIAEAVEF